MAANKHASYKRAQAITSQGNRTKSENMDNNNRLEKPGVIWTPLATKNCAKMLPKSSTHPLLYAGVPTVAAKIYNNCVKLTGTLLCKYTQISYSCKKRSISLDISHAYYDRRQSVDNNMSTYYVLFKQDIKCDRWQTINMQL